MITLAEAIPPHFSLIVHSTMTQKESKVIVMIALGSFFKYSNMWLQLIMW